MSYSHRNHFFINNQSSINTSWLYVFDRQLLSRSQHSPADFLFHRTWLSLNLPDLIPPPIEALPSRHSKPHSSHMVLYHNTLPSLPVLSGWKNSQSFFFNFESMSPTCVGQRAFGTYRNINDGGDPFVQQKRSIPSMSSNPSSALFFWMNFPRPSTLIVKANRFFLLLFGFVRPTLDNVIYRIWNLDHSSEPFADGDCWRNSY
ncbi:hypothetical protein BKA69DRAFT_300221 [Paraphysoderma sedebokerense]|nr:hypothetical protein BKA69DRAFT_300221 [Paraphysoderma sedebokerense]